MNTVVDEHDAAAEATIENLTYDELRIGQHAQFQHTVTMEDIQAFALLSGDVNPTHLDPSFAEGSRAHGVVAHSMFTGALISGLLGTEFPGPGTVYAEQKLVFHRPVHVGDTLGVKVTVVQKLDGRRVQLDCEVSNQRSERVVSGLAVVQAPARKVVRQRTVLPQLHLFAPEARLKAWMRATRPGAPVTCAVVHPCDESSLRGALDAAHHGFIDPRLVGPAGRIRTLAAQLELSLEGVALVDAPHSHAAADAAAELAARGEVSMLMKGSLHTDEMMQAVIAQPRLRTGRRMSHVFRFEVPAYGKPLLVTDAAINIAPSLDEKADIVRNAVELAQVLGVARPRVALLSAVETVTAKLASTLDAAALCKMADRGQIAGAVLDGPLAFDNAISAEAAQVKGIVSPVAGEADILVVPDLEAGNMLAKQLEYLAGAASCGVVLGARVPIALTSRADSATSRMASTALAGLVARRATIARHDEH